MGAFGGWAPLVNEDHGRVASGDNYNEDFPKRFDLEEPWYKKKKDGSGGGDGSGDGSGGDEEEDEEENDDAGGGDAK